MKKQFLMLGTALLFVVGSVTFTSCGSEEHTEEVQHSESETTEDTEHAHYQCPMKCEGQKTYEAAGSCSVCGMDLKEVE